MDSVKSKISTCIATGLYIGFMPVAPGTFGSILGVIFVFLGYGLSTTFQWACCLLSFVLGVYASRNVAKERQHPDPPYVVIDEICGIFVTFLLIPISWPILIMGFLLFRIFDIFKLPFIRRLETVPNGYGIMLDDVAAGILSNILIRILLLVLP